MFGVFLVAVVFEINEGGDSDKIDIVESFEGAEKKEGAEISDHEEDGGVTGENVGDEKDSC